MTGIFGVFDLDCRPASETECSVVADARLDYRDELCRSLGLARSEAIDDADLILTAYLKWGEACVDHLLGDFAFAIRDPREKKLFCARDHFGMRPFYYHHEPSKRFVFASDAREVFRVPDVPYAINEGRIADFLVPELEWIDYTSTFYVGVYRLPPGHALTVTPDTFGVTEYWTPAPGPELPSMSDEEYREGFMEIFTRAVGERLREPKGKVGAMLSGGMDSGAVAAIATDLLRNSGADPLRTVSAARERGTACDESQRIYASIDMLGTASTIVLPDYLAKLGDQPLANMEEPFDGVFLFMKAIFLAAHEQGLKALLDGGAGDIVINEGSYITRLLRQGHFVTAYRELNAAPMFWNESNTLAETIRHLLRAAVPEVVKAQIRPYRRRVTAKGFLSNSIISPEFANEVDIKERFERMWRIFPADWVTDPAVERTRKIRPNISAGRERYARLASFAGIEARDPFLDRNVVAYCSQLPGHMLFRDGWPKFFLRTAMAGKLPDAVRWGRDKPHIGWVYNELLVKRENSRGRLSLEYLAGVLGDYVSAESLRQAWQAFEHGSDFQAVHNAYVLSQWLGQTATRPVVKNQEFR